jgi:hypothetical protein
VNVYSHAAALFYHAPQRFGVTGPGGPGGAWRRRHVNLGHPCLPTSCATNLIQATLATWYDDQSEEAQQALVNQRVAITV